MKSGASNDVSYSFIEAVCWAETEIAVAKKSIGNKKNAYRFIKTVLLKWTIKESKKSRNQE